MKHTLEGPQYLVTGATGFIGTWLLKELPHAIGIDSKDCDIRDYTAVREIILKNKPTHLMHLAAIANPETCEKNPELAWNVNVKGTENVLRAAKEQGIKTAIMSTALVYKETGQALKETDELKTQGNVYMKTKLESERLAKEYGAIIIRAFNQEGPNRPGEYFTSQVIISCIKEKEMQLWNPYQVREYMDVRDGARGIHLILEKGQGTYNLSTGVGISKLDYVKLVENVLGKKMKYTITKNEDSSIIIGDNTRLRELGWTPKYTIKQTILDQSKNVSDDAKLKKQ